MKSPQSFVLRRMRSRLVLNERICTRAASVRPSIHPSTQGKICNFGKTRKDYRWALGAVRRFAFNLTKRTSGRSFLALVPYVGLLCVCVFRGAIVRSRL